ncbi:hypothetical protein [Rhizobium phage RHph_X2_30]|nr:hypothetical protein [Rhizobium phage RHph_X2_30]
MPFNSDTYHANKAKRQAWDNLERAREIRARVIAGTAFDWEIPRVAFYAKQARFWMHSYLNMRRIAEMKRESRNAR